METILAALPYIGIYFLIGAISSGIIILLATGDDPSGDANLAGCAIAFAAFFAWWLVWPWLIWVLIQGWLNDHRWRHHR